MSIYRKRARHRAPVPRSWVAKPEIVVPAATTLLALIVGTALNSIETRRLERQKFEFEVLKYSMSAAKDSESRLGMLCDFAAIGFIDDVDHRYERAEIAGRRPCASPQNGLPFQTDQALRSLINDVGIASTATGPASFEQGFLKVDGRVGNVRITGDHRVRPIPVRVISIGALISTARPWKPSLAGARKAEFVIDRDGSITQLNNIFSAQRGIARIALVNAGELRFGIEARGIGFRLHDSSGAVVPRDEGIDFHGVGINSVGTQRFPPAQLRSAAQLTSAICAAWPQARLVISPHLQKITMMQSASDIIKDCASRTERLIGAGSSPVENHRDYRSST